MLIVIFFFRVFGIEKNALQKKLEFTLRYGERKVVKETMRVMKTERERKRGKKGNE